MKPTARAGKLINAAGLSSEERGGYTVPSICEILSALNAKQLRCADGAVAGALGFIPIAAGRHLGERRQCSSWVVNAKKRKPAGCSCDLPHPKLKCHPKTISGPEELRDICRSGG